MSQDPIIAQDLMLLLFDPRSGSIAGEGTLFYTLAGAVLADLALQNLAEVDESSPLRGPIAHAMDGGPPGDPLLAEVWEGLRRRPQGVQTVLASAGPRLREPVLDRLVEHGHIRREKRKLLGFISTTGLLDGGSGRREELLAAVRPVLVEVHRLRRGRRYWARCCLPAAAYRRCTVTSRGPGRSSPGAKSWRPVTGAPRLPAPPSPGRWWRSWCPAR